MEKVYKAPLYCSNLSLTYAADRLPLTWSVHVLTLMLPTCKPFLLMSRAVLVFRTPGVGSKGLCCSVSPAPLLQASSQQGHGVERVKMKLLDLNFGGALRASQRSRNETISLGAGAEQGLGTAGGIA